MPFFYPAWYLDTGLQQDGRTIPVILVCECDSGILAGTERKGMSIRQGDAIFRFNLNS